MSKIVNILGIGLRAQSMEEAVAAIAAWIEQRRATYVCVSSVNNIVESQRDPALKTIHNAAGMVTTDGMPLVWLCRKNGHKTAQRIYGPDLMLEICSASVERNWRHFLYGATPEVLERLGNNLQARFPGLVIAGSYAPPFRPLTEGEDHEITARINAAKADVIWVGLNTPKQERWMAAHLDRVSAPVMIGVGAAFDFHAGTKRQAPRWMRRHGLEWLFRLACEPRRLGRRYLVGNTVFLWLLALQALSLRAFPLGKGR